MRATDLLEKDHQAVKKLFKQYENAGDRAVKTKASIFEKIRTALEAHATAEEEIFYPAIRESEDAGKKANELVNEAFEEHRVVRTLLDEISELEASEDAFKAKMKVMIENVEHHIDEEEDELFPEIEDSFSDEELEDLGKRLEARMQVLRSGDEEEELESEEE